MDEKWFYAQNKERKGPITALRLKQLAREGWLTPDDLVWKEGMPEWVPAGKVRGLFGSSLVQSLAGGIDGVLPQKPVNKPKEESPPEEPPAPAAAKPDSFDFSPRHVIAGIGGFIAALGVAFTAIAQSPLSLAFTLGGLALAAVGMYVEVGKLTGQAIENIGKASKLAAERRQDAVRLAVGKKRLEVEAKKLAKEQAAVQQQTALSASPASGPAQPAGGNVVVINQPPIQKWSPGLAAVLSFFIPGLGQLYKGQILNGIVWFFLVGFGYLALILPGLILHLFCILGALSGNPWTEGKTTVVRQ